MKKFLCLLCLVLVSVFYGHSQQIVFTPQWTPQSQFAGYYAALENGFYAEQGLDVVIKHPTLSYGSVSMLKDGTSDFITCELCQAMTASNENLNMVNILQTTQHSTLLVITREKNITKLTDLAGRRIGTWKVGFSEILQMIVAEQHLGVEWIYLNSPINLFITGAIDATLAKSYNELISFYMSGITPGSLLYLADVGYDFPEDGLYVKESYFKRYPERCRKFAEASRKGWEWVRNHPDEAFEIVMKYIRQENLPANRYAQKWMIGAVLKAQEDSPGSAPSFTLKEEAFNRMNEALMSCGCLSKPLNYKRFTGGVYEK
jgi:NitT/TauT family transport system substrate-binding protein